MSGTFISLVAEPLEPNGPPVGDHHQLKMPGTLYLNITPETARQWIAQLEPIAAKENKA